MEWLKLIAELAVPVSLIITILSFAQKQKREAVEDTRQDATQTATMLVQLGTINANTEQIKKDLEKQGDKIDGLSQDMASVKATLDGTQNRLDALEKWRDARV